MKLYEVNQAIEDIFEQLVDPDTGEVLADEALMAQLEDLQLERNRILEYLAKLVLNTRAQAASLYPLPGLRVEGRRKTPQGAPSHAGAEG